MTEIGSKPHGHGRYVIAIIAVGIVALLIGVFYGYATAPAAVTFLQGKVTLSAQYHGTPHICSFANAHTLNLTSIVTNQTYLVYLPSNFSYIVTVQWINLTSGPYLGIHTCNPIPSSFSPSGQNETQTFTC